MMLYSIKEVIKRGNRVRSSLYRDVQCGLMVSPVKLGTRAVGLPAHEVDQLLTARACGANDEQVKALVTRLMAERAERLKTILGGAAA